MRRKLHLFLRLETLYRQGRPSKFFGPGATYQQLRTCIKQFLVETHPLQSVNNVICISNIYTLLLKSIFLIFQNVKGPRNLSQINFGAKNSDMKYICKSLKTALRRVTV